MAALPRDVLRCVALIPLSVAALVTGSARVWRHLDRRPASASPARVHALAGLVLGLVALVPLGVVVLAVLRGVFYGLWIRQI